MPRACASRGGQPAPYTKRHKRPWDYTSLYRRHPHLRHWLHNPISQGHAAGAFGVPAAPEPEEPQP